MIEPLQSIDQFHRLRAKLSSAPKPQLEIRVCSTGCRALGALEVCDALEREITRRNLTRKVRVVRAGCLGLCAGAVAVAVEPAGKLMGPVIPSYSMVRSMVMRERSASAEAPARAAS